MEEDKKLQYPAPVRLPAGALSSPITGEPLYIRRFVQAGLSAGEADRAEKKLQIAFNYRGPKPSK